MTSPNKDTLQTGSYKTATTLLWLLFAAYLFVMALLLFFRGMQLPERSANLKPFDEIVRFSRLSWRSGTFLVNIVGNICCFVPLGMFLAVLFPGHAPLCAAAACLTSVSVETIQYFTRTGYAATDDVILNTLGSTLGVLAVVLVRRLCKKEARTRWVCLGFLLAISLVMTPFILQTVSNRIAQYF